MVDLYKQYELVKGTTHMIAWYNQDDIIPAQKEWSILHAYKTVLIRNKEGFLVEPQE